MVLTLEAEGIAHASGFNCYAHRICGRQLRGRGDLDCDLLVLGTGPGG